MKYIRAVFFLKLVAGVGRNRNGPTGVAFLPYQQRTSGLFGAPNFAELVVSCKAGDPRAFCYFPAYSFLKKLVLSFFLGKLSSYSTQKCHQNRRIFSLSVAFSKRTVHSTGQCHWTWRLWCSLEYRRVSSTSFEFAATDSAVISSSRLCSWRSDKQLWKSSSHGLLFAINSRSSSRTGALSKRVGSVLSSVSYWLVTWINGLCSCDEKKKLNRPCGKVDKDHRTLKKLKSLPRSIVSLLTRIRVHQASDPVCHFRYKTASFLRH